MVAQIDTLITWQDGDELARDQVFNILSEEVAEQQVLAAAASEDPNDWKLIIRRERHNPIEDWLNQDNVTDYAPIVNVWLERWRPSQKTSHVRGERGTAVIHCDCFGLGQSSSAISGGHTPGDENAALVAQRAGRLVRNILLSEHYTYLGSPRKENQWVFGRKVEEKEGFQPQIQARTAQSIIGVRLTVEVEVQMRVPTVVGQEIEKLTARFERDTDGKLLAKNAYSFIRLVAEDGDIITTESGDELLA